VTPTPTLIAIVDDEEPIRRALRRLLASAGFQVDVFSDGDGFMRSLASRTPECVVLDLHMPESDGFAVMDKLVLLPNRIPVVVITGHDTVESRQRVKEYGITGYFRKPVDGQQLINAIQEAQKPS